MSSNSHRIPREGMVTGALFLLVVVPGLVFLIWRSSIAKDIADLQQTAHNAGEPISLEKLAAWRKAPPDDENVFVALRALWETEDPAYWKAFHNQEQTLPDRKALDVPVELPILGAEAKNNSSRLPWTSDQVELVREFERNNRDRAEKARRALALPRAHIPINPYPVYHDRSPHLPFLKQESRRLLLRCLLAANDQNGASSLDSIEQILQLAESLFRSVDLKMAFYQALIGERALNQSIFTTPAEQLIPRRADGEADSPTDRVINSVTLNRSPINAIGFFSLDHLLLLKTFDKLNRDSTITTLHS